MHLGTLLPTFSTGEHTVSPDTLETWTKRTEEAGFESLWVYEHLTKPDPYQTSSLDPVTSLGYAAALTSRISLGTSIFLLPQRRTAKAAHAISTIAHLLEDRDLRLGVGPGYEPREFEAVGVPKSERGRRLDEGLAVMNEFFEGDATFEGEFHDFDGIRISPVPKDPPSFLSAGRSIERDGEYSIPTPVLDRIIRTRGWIAAPSPVDQLEAEMEEIETYATEHDVDPESISTAIINYTHLPPDGDLDAQIRAFENFYAQSRSQSYIENNCLVGGPECVLETLQTYESIGFDTTIIGHPGNVLGDSTSLPEQLSLIADELLPKFV